MSFTAAEIRDIETRSERLQREFFGKRITEPRVCRALADACHTILASLNPPDSQPREKRLDVIA